jgi:hypothetical protein
VVNLVTFINRSLELFTMMQITLLKVKHEGMAEAEKLRPYIQRAHVFGCESAGMKEEEARKTERFWLNLIRTISAEDFRVVCPQFYPYHAQLQRDYCVVRDGYLFAHTIPLWHIERFNPQEARHLKKAAHNNNQLYTQALLALGKGNRDLFLQHVTRYFEENDRLMNLRDKEMARNLASAEARIRKNYPFLRDKDPLSLTACVGALHNPERSLSSPVEVINLCDSTPLDCTARVNHMRKQNVPYSEMRDALVELGYHDLHRRSFSL